ncbi:MAG: RNA methyltransferase [Desulfurococcales archaeon]|nr:RNA methyltransferase [Desulfurococcales archaeon]
MDRLRLVLVGTEGAMNLGVAARLARNFEVDELYLVSPKTSVEEAMEYSARGAEVLARARIVEALEEALKEVSLSVCTTAIARERDVLRNPVSPEKAAEIAASSQGIVALVFGRESVGLTRSEIAQCSLLSTIPANPEYPTLNLATSIAIYLYEIYKIKGKTPQLEPPDERLLSLLEGYTRALVSAIIEDAKRSSDIVVALRRMAAKSGSRREVEHLLYLLSKTCRRIPGCTTS